MVEKEDDEDPTQETVTFLYKYAPGSCPKSYGFNAAKLAGMPPQIIKRAYEVSCHQKFNSHLQNFDEHLSFQLSKTVEAEALKRKTFTKSLLQADRTEVQDLLRKLKGCRL